MNVHAIFSQVQKRELERCSILVLALLEESNRCLTWALDEVEVPKRSADAIETSFYSLMVWTRAHSTGAGVVLRFGHGRRPVSDLWIPRDEWHRSYFNISWRKTRGTGFMIAEVQLMKFEMCCWAIGVVCNKSTGLQRIIKKERLVDFCNVVLIS